MLYEDSSGNQIKYDVEILTDKDRQPFGVIISEAEGNEHEINREIIEDASSAIFQSEGKHQVFIEKQNGNYDDFQVEITLNNTEFEAEIIGEHREVSENMVNLYREQAESIQTSKAKTQTNER